MKHELSSLERARSLAHVAMGEADDAHAATWALIAIAESLEKIAGMTPVPPKLITRAVLDART